MTDFAQLTDLFQEGMVLELTKGDKAVTVWINKMSPFELEEARQAGKVARARTMLAIKEVGSPEFDLFRLEMSALNEDGLLNLILAAESNAWFATAIRDIHSDPEWTERIEIVERSADQVAGRADDDPEVVLLVKATQEYSAHVSAMVDDARAERRAQLIGSTREQLEEIYVDIFMKNEGLSSFSREFERAEVHHVMRSCEAVRNESGDWLHAACNHDVKIVKRDEVGRLPDLVWTKVRDAIKELNMPPDVARFSAAPASSSASLEQPSEAAAESIPSTPEGTPAELVGTSAAPSTTP